MFLSGNDNHISRNGSVQALNADYYGLWNVPYKTELYLFLASLPKKGGFTSTFMQGREMASWLKPENNPLITKDSNILLLYWESSATIIVQREIWKKTLFSTLQLKDGLKLRGKKENILRDVYTDKSDLLYFSQEPKLKSPIFSDLLRIRAPHWPLQVDEEYWKNTKGAMMEAIEALKKSV